MSHWLRLASFTVQAPLSSQPCMENPRFFLTFSVKHFQSNCTKQAQKKDSFFVSKWQLRKKGAKKITGLDGYLVKEQNRSYLGTLHFSTLCFMTSDLAFITQAEVTASNIPHLPVVPDCAVIQTASLGRHTLLTALPSTLHFVLSLQNINNHWAGLSEPFHVGKVTPEACASELNDFQLPSDT